MTVSTLNGVEARAIELVCNGHVGAEIKDARVFPVRSKDGTCEYTAIVTPDLTRSRCDCPATTSPCKHSLAASLKIQVNAQADDTPYEVAQLHRAVSRASALMSEQTRLDFEKALAGLGEDVITAGKPDFDTRVPV